MSRARLKRFYSFTEFELDNLEPKEWDGYLQCIRVLSAREKLEEVNVATFPHLKKKSRADIAKKYRKDATSLMPKKRLTMKEAMEKMGSLVGRRK